MAISTTALDIANRALQHLGVPRISSFTEQSKQATEVNFSYDKLRIAELRRSVWGFATRRAVLRAFTATTELVTPPVWSAGSYGAGIIVQDSNGFYWISTVASNSDVPGTGTKWIAYYGPDVADNHDTTINYIPGDMVYSSTTAYLCIKPSLNHAPPNGTYWVAQTATLSTPVEIDPLGYSPDTTAVRNRYKLPANWLRMAPQDPKTAAAVRQQSTAGMRFNDWELEFPYILTTDTGAKVLRFVCDVTSVPLMDTMFREGLAARMAMEMCETLTQSKEKLADVSAKYNDFINEARVINAIEAGSTENDEVRMSAMPAEAGVPAARQ